MPHIKLIINLREISVFVNPDTNMMISDNKFNLPPIVLFKVHAVLKSLPFHCIATVHLSNLNNVKMDNFVTFLVNPCVRAITAPIP